MDHPSRIGDYLITKELIGEGNNSTVRLARHLPSTLTVAVKIIDIRQKENKDRAFNEIEKLNMIDDTKVIKYYWHYEDESFMYLFLEYFPNGDFFQFLERKTGKLNEEDARFYFKQMVSAVVFCHEERKVVHHDVKLENFLIAGDGQVRLADFGLAVEMEAALMCFHGSPIYMAPELFAMQVHNEKVDVWGLGVCLYFMLVGQFPFSSHIYSHLEELVLFEQVSFPKKLGLSKEVKDIIRKMLRKDFNTRLSSEEIKQHRWMQRRKKKKRTKRSKEKHKHRKKSIDSKSSDSFIY